MLAESQLCKVKLAQLDSDPEKLYVRKWHSQSLEHNEFLLCKNDNLLSYMLFQAIKIFQKRVLKKKKEYFKRKAGGGMTCKD